MSSDRPPRALAFWMFFESEAAPRLELRVATMRQVFRHLDTLDHPVLIAETGCARTPGNWAGDGQSTVLFDRYVAARADGSACHTVDISADAVAACRAMVGPHTTVHHGDSVAFLHRFSAGLPPERAIDLLYLDSFDLDPVYWFASAAHHLKELLAAARALTPRTLVVVDDAPQSFSALPASDNTLNLLAPPVVGGKGRLVAEYAAAIGAAPAFAGYQAGWTGF